MSPLNQSIMACPEETIYAFNEFFQTLQGEGHWSGTPMALLRLQGCPVQCAWCDTKHSWFKNIDNFISIKECVSKKDSSPHWANATAQELFKVASEMDFPIKNLLLTGGEPACMDLTQICDTFELNGWSIFLETSGTEEIRGSQSMWVTVSPKFNMRGRNAVRTDALERANEIKFVVARATDLKIFEEALQTANLKKDVIISLQPVAQNPNIISFCVTSIMKKNWRLSLQTHKFLNIR